LIPKYTTSAVARKVSALKYSARCVALIGLRPVERYSVLTIVLAPASNRPATTGVTP